MTRVTKYSQSNVLQECDASNCRCVSHLASLPGSAIHRLLEMRISQLDQITENALE